MAEIKGYEYPEELLKWLQVGNVVRVNIVYKSPVVVYHILAIVDEDRAVVKSWWRRKQRWHYQVIQFYSFLLDYEGENIEFVKKEQPND